MIDITKVKALTDINIVGREKIVLVARNPPVKNAQKSPEIHPIIDAHLDLNDLFTKKPPTFNYNIILINTKEIFKL